VDDRLTNSRWRRGLLAVGWSLFFVALLYGLDRVLLEKKPVEGWVEVESIQDIPSDVGPVMIPSYLPYTLSWPPSRVVYRTGDNAGWWIGLRSDEDATEDLWYGMGSEPFPEAMGDTFYCLDVATRTECPEGWFALSTNVRGHVLSLISRLDALTTREILTGFQLADDN